MKNLRYLLLVTAAALTIFVEAAEQFVSFKPQQGFVRFDIASAKVVVDDKEDPAVHHAVKNLREDIRKVGRPTPNLFQGRGEGCAIVVGTIESPLIRKYIKSGLIDEKELKGKWEKYLIVSPSAPQCGDSCAQPSPLPREGKEVAHLLIVGSDRRGCVYGIYELSRQLGVSPWYWWADIPVVQHDEFFLKPGLYTDGEPKVKYRGIFINDENPCMQKWARLKFGGMNSKMYERVYELLLRMKANLLWPGMWGTFKEYKPMVPVFQNPDGTLEGNCFNWDDPMNPRLAHEMGIVVGTSHHEPMQRSQQEWVRTKQNYGNGEWNYMTNEEGLKKFFREGIENTKDYESMITVGLRGDEDRPMADAGGREANMRLLIKIFNDQKKIINSVMGKKAKDMPLVWTLYSEMLDYYEDGFQVPDDVIVMLCDDNWGDIRKIPSIAPLHPGGGLNRAASCAQPSPLPREGAGVGLPGVGHGLFGMYYHFSYYGAPRAMKWLQQMQIQHVWQQMDIAYKSGIDQVWITNVGDIKPAEFVTQFFMDMAWNPDRFNENNLMDYTEQFCRQFAGDNAKEAARLLNLYNKYAARVTAEMLNEDTYPLAELKQYRDEFLALEAEALRIFPSPGRGQGWASYYQLILFPIQALANLYDLYYSVAMNRHLANLNDMEANDWADRAEQCFERDSLLTHYYNKVMSDGKWDGIMTQTHIGYTTWHAPQFNTMPKVVRLDPATARRGGVVHEMEHGAVDIDARHYFAATAADGYAWNVVPHLGKTSSALTLTPQLAPVDGASLAYRFRATNAEGKMKVKVVFSTVMPFVKGGHDVELGFTGCESQTENLNKDMNWQHCYDLMYPAGAARVIEKEVVLPVKPISSDGVFEFVLRPLTPGIVVQRVIILEK